MENTLIEKKQSGISSSDTEGARRATGVSDDRPNPEVTDRPKRRRYTESYKRKIVEEVSALRSSGNGQIGSYLRREGIYYSMVMKWERKLSQGSRDKSKGGRKQKSREDFEVEIQKLKKELKRAKKKLAKSELIIEIQKKFQK
jgi:transposase-like protein